MNNDLSLEKKARSLVFFILLGLAVIIISIAVLSGSLEGIIFWPILFFFLLLPFSKTRIFINSFYFKIFGKNLFKIKEEEESISSDNDTAYADHKITVMQDGDPLLQINPNQIKCGFIMYPEEIQDAIDSKLLNPHEVLESSQPRFWPDVHYFSPQIEIHLLLVYPSIEIGALKSALLELGYHDGYNILVSSETKFSFDGGSTTHQVYVGFCWRSKYPEIIVAGPDNVISSS